MKGARQASLPSWRACSETMRAGRGRSQLRSDTRAVKGVWRDRNLVVDATAGGHSRGRYASLQAGPERLRSRPRFAKRPRPVRGGGSAPGRIRRARTLRSEATPRSSAEPGPRPRLATFSERRATNPGLAKSTETHGSSRSTSRSEATAFSTDEHGPPTRSPGQLQRTTRDRPGAGGRAPRRMGRPGRLRDPRPPRSPRTNTGWRRGAGQLQRMTRNAHSMDSRATALQLHLVAVLGLERSPHHVAARGGVEIPGRALRGARTAVFPQRARDHPPAPKQVGRDPRARCLVRSLNLVVPRGTSNAGTAQGRGRTGWRSVRTARWRQARPAPRE